MLWQCSLLCMPTSFPNLMVPFSPFTAPSGSKSREVVIASGSGVSVSFMVVPQTLGNIPITVRANTPTAADVVTKQLLVKV